MVALILALATTGGAQAKTAPPASSGVHLSAAVVAFWERVGACETGGGGPALWDWGARHRPSEGHTFEGGVGFYWGTWRAWAGELGLLRRYPHAYNAPKMVQIEVAQMGLVRHNGYWGCLTEH